MSLHSSPLPDIDYQHHRVRADDGVDLAIQTVGEGPAVILANGIGVTTPGLDLLADHLRQRHRVVCWDYRGIRRSATNGTDVDFSVERHATDAVEILDALGVERAAVFGWSMGVPVGLEMIRRAPGRIAAYGALFGAAGRPFRSGFPNAVAEVTESLFRLSYRFPFPAQSILTAATIVPDVAWLICSSARFVGPRANRAIFDRDVYNVAQADKAAYFKTMIRLIEHDGRDVLASIQCPCLIVAGTQDWLTPPAAAEEMARTIPDAELLVLPQTTHFGVIEHGPALWDPIDALLERAF